MQNRPERCVFLVPLNEKCHLEGSFVSLSMLAFRFGTNYKDIHKINRISISLLRKLQIWNILFLDNILLMASSKENLALWRKAMLHLASESRFFDNFKERSPPAKSDFVIFRHGNQLSRYDIHSLKRKERADCATVPESFWVVISCCLQANQLIGLLRQQELQHFYSMTVGEFWKEV